MKRSNKILAIILVLAMLFSVYVPTTASALSDVEYGPSKEPWTAQWIWNASTGEADQWMCFRKTVTLGEVPASVTARIAIDSRYWLWINGEMVVFEGQLKRGPTRTDSYFDRVDITKYLKPGENTIAVLGNFFGKNGYSHINSGKAGFLFEADFGGQIIKSDTSWKVKLNPPNLKGASIGGSQSNGQPNSRIAESNFVYDARLQMDGWQQTGFDDSAWGNAIELGAPPCAPWNNLWERSIPQLKDYGLKEYTNMDEYRNMITTQDTTFTMRVPYNAQLTPYLKVDAPAGLRIEMKTDNYTDPAGNGANIRSMYTTRAGVQEFECLSWMNGQEVYYIIPAGVKVISLQYRETGYASEFEGSFTSDDSFFNTLWEQSKRTLYVTMRDNFMDCPDRERAQWWGDVTNEMMMMMYALDTNSYDLYRKGIDTLRGWSSGNELYTVVPDGTGTNYRLPQQMLAGIAAFWEYYLYTGDAQKMAEIYPYAKSYLEKWTMASSGLVNHQAGSWDWGDWGSNIDMAPIENAWYYLCCKNMSQLAEVTDNLGDIMWYEERMESIEGAYDAAFWTGTSYKNAVSRPDDRPNALAVVSGLASPDKYPAIKQVLTTSFDSSPYMEKYVLDALCEMGYMDAAQARIKNRYEPMVVSQYYSTLWEFWNKNQGTKNHAWTGGPLITMSKYMAGVKPLTPSYDNYQIAPDMGSINQIICRVPSVKGDIDVTLNRNAAAKTLAMNVVSPADTVARVGVPRYAGENTRVTLGGQVIYVDGSPTGAVPGVVYDGDDEQHIFFLVQPGTYDFGADVKAHVPQDTYTVTIPAAIGGAVEVNGQTVTLPYSNVVNAGTQIEVKAVADAGKVFAGWSGSNPSSAATQTITVNANTNLIARFETPSYTVYRSVFIDGAGSGLSVKKGNATFKLPATLAVKDGESLTFEIVEPEVRDYNFVAWSGDFFSTKRSITITPTEDMKLNVLKEYKGGAVNLALGKTVTTTRIHSTGIDWRPANLTDGYTTWPGPQGQNGFTTTVLPSMDISSTPHEISIDLGSVQTFDTVTLYPRLGVTDVNGGSCNFPVDFKIMTSTDGSAWNEAIDVKNLANPNGNPAAVSFNAISARYVKLVTYKVGLPASDEGSGNSYRLQLLEITVTNNQPLPANSTLNLTGANGRVLVNGELQELPFSREYPTGTKFALVPVPDEDCVVNGFTGKTSSNDVPFYVELNGDMSFEAKFTKLPKGGEPESLTKYAQGKTVNTLNNDGGASQWARAYLTDGITLSEGTSLSGIKGWTSTGYSTQNPAAAQRPWVEIDLASNVDINQVVLYPRHGDDAVTANGNGESANFPTYYNIEVKDSAAGTYRTVAEYEGMPNPMGKPQVCNFDLTNARFVRITAVTLGSPTSDEGPTITNRYRFQLAEVEVNKDPQNPVNILKNAGVSLSALNADGGGVGSAWNIQNLIDGIWRCKGFGLTTGTKGYTSTGYPNQDISANPHWIDFDLGFVQTFNRFELYPRTDVDGTADGSGLSPNFPTNYKIQIRNSTSEAWSTIYQVEDGENPRHKPVLIDLGLQTARYIRLETTKLGVPSFDEGVTVVNKLRVQFAEARVGYIAIGDVIEHNAGAVSVAAADNAEALINRPDGTLGLTADIINASQGDNGIVWSLEDENGFVKGIADLWGTNTLNPVVTPNEEGIVYAVARSKSGFGVVDKLPITIAYNSEPTPKVEAGIVDEDGNPVESPSFETNAPFTVSVTTPADVEYIKLVNENGMTIGKTVVSVTDNGNGTKTWILSLSVSTAGAGRVLDIYTAGSDKEYSDTGAAVSFDITGVAPAVLSVESTDLEEEVAPNSLFTITVVTTKTIDKVKLSNETGSSIGIISKSYVIEGNNKIWTITTKIGTAGKRVITVYGAPKDGEYLEKGVSFKANIFNRT